MFSIKIFLLLSLAVAINAQTAGHGADCDLNGDNQARLCNGALHLECVAAKCRCKDIDNMVWESGKCLALADGPCDLSGTNPVTCVPNADCHEHDGHGMCHCDKGDATSERKCTATGSSAVFKAVELWFMFLIVAVLKFY